MIHQIIVPLDGSPFGEHALPSALAIARRAGAELQIVHVHPPWYAGGTIATDMGVGAVMERARAYLHEVIDRLAKMANVPVTERLLNGPIAESLTAHIQEEKADLVVMSTHGRGPVSRFWLGSVADRLIREAPAPVLLVRPQPSPPDFAGDPIPSRVLVPLDGSLLAEQVLETIRGFAQLTGASLFLLRVTQPVNVSEYVLSGQGLGVHGIPLAEELQQAEEQVHREAEDYLDGVARRLRAKGLLVQTRVVSHEQPFAAILDQARSDGVDLIALATHGRQGISRLMLGSVADKVVRGTSLPVLVQRPQPLGEPAAAAVAEPAAQVAVPNPGCVHGQTMHP